MATLLNAVSADTTGTGASHVGPCTVHFEGSMGGGFVRLLMASADANYREFHTTRYSQPIDVNAQGTYYLRADLIGSSGASLTVKTTQ